MDRLFVSEHDPGGEVATVVLVHGSLDRSAAFARVQRHLTDLRVLRYDRRGYGRSLGVAIAEGFDAQVDDLAGVVGTRSAVIVGHSLGGVVALAFAERHPALAEAVVAYEAPMSWTPWWPTTSAGAAATGHAGDAADAAERFMRRMVGDDRWEALPRRTRDQRRAEGPALLAELRSIRDAAEPPYDPARIAVPVIAAHGSESSDHHRQTAVALADLVSGAELVVVDGARHGVHLTHPEAFAALVRRGVARARA